MIKKKKNVFDSTNTYVQATFNQLNQSLPSFSPGITNDLKYFIGD